MHTLSLHDALPISQPLGDQDRADDQDGSLLDRLAEEAAEQDYVSAIDELMRRLQ